MNPDKWSDDDMTGYGVFFMVIIVVVLLLKLFGS